MCIYIYTHIRYLKKVGAPILHCVNSVLEKEVDDRTEDDDQGVVLIVDPSFIVLSIAADSETETGFPNCWIYLTLFLEVRLDTSFKNAFNKGPALMSLTL